MKNASIKSTKKMNWARWVARILSSLIIIIWGFIFFSQLFTNYYDETGAFSPTEGAIYTSIFTILLLLGTIIGWVNEKWGGIALIVGFLGSAIGGYVMAASHSDVPVAAFIPVILFLPFLISGILFILFWSKNRKSLSPANESGT